LTLFSRRSNEEGADDIAQRPAELPWPGVPVSLRVADGFKFGCGLMLAGATALVLILLFAAVAVMTAKLTGSDIALPSPAATVGPN